MITASSRAKLRKYLTQHTFYFSIIFGLVSIQFNFKRRKFSHCQYLKVYVASNNALTIVVTPMLLLVTKDEGVFYSDNWQMKLVTSTNVSLRFVVVILTLLFRTKRERGMQTIIESLLKLEQEYFESVPYPKDILTAFDRMMYLKFLAAWNQSLGALYVICRFMENTSLWWYVSLIYGVTVMNILHGVILHYYMCLLYIGSRFAILNYRLSEILMVMRRVKKWPSRRSQYHMERALAVELDHITCVHRNLQKTVHELNDLYKFQIMTVLLSQVFNNTTTGYYCVLMTLDSSKFQMTTYDVVLGIMNYGMVLLDMYLVDIISHSIEMSYGATGALLRTFNEFDELEESLVISCELMSLHLMQQKLFISIGGMFKLNKHTSFVMFGFTLRQVIILVQNDFAIAYRSAREQHGMGVIWDYAIKQILGDDGKEYLK